MIQMNFRKFMAGLTITIMILGAGFPVAEAAKREGRKAGGENRVQSRSADRPAQRPADRPEVKPADRNTNVSNNDRNTNVNTGNVNVERNTNVNVDPGYGVPVGGAYHGGAYYHGENYYSGSTVAGAFIGGLVIGAIINSPPPESQTVVVNEVQYIYDGTNYYQAVYNGAEVVYKVVPKPN